MQAPDGEEPQGAGRACAFAHRVRRGRRRHEALTALPLRRGSAVSGLFVGCFIANSLGPNGMMDAVIGSVLTLIAAVITYYLREKNFFVSMLAPVVINAVGIGLMIKYIYADTLSLYCS